MSFVETFEESKKEIKHIAKNLKENGFISEETLNNVSQALEKEKITIAIVGQMKYGKSTFINAFLFKDKFLPTSDTPMTAVLTEIVYDELPSFIVEFYTKEELETLKIQAKKEKGNNIFEEFLDKLSYIENEVQDLLGTRKIISPEEFEDYVGADGKFTPITKMLIVNHNSDILKETIIVDTPGLNDPVESREKITENFLSKADVIIIFLYAQRPFDNNDRELIIEKLSFAGTGKVVLVINKQDMILEELGILEKVKEHVKHSLEKAVSKGVSSDVLKNTLLKAPLIPMSSLWALIGRIDENTLETNEELKWYYDDFRKKYPFLKTKDDFEKYSGIVDLESEISDLVKNEKVKIIKTKAATLIVSDIVNQLKELIDKKIRLEQEYHILSKTKEEIEENEKKFEKFRRYDYPEIVKIEDIKRTISEMLLEEEQNIDNILQVRRKNLISKIDKVDKGIFAQITKRYAKTVNSILYEEFIETREEFRKNLYKIRRKIIILLEEWLDNIINNLLNNNIINFYSDIYLDNLYSWKNYVIELYNLSWDKKIEKIQLAAKLEEDYSELIVKELIDKNIEHLRRKIKENFIKDDLKYTIEDKLKDIKKEIDNIIINPIKETHEKVKVSLEEREKRQKELEEEISIISKKIEELEAVKKEVENKLRGVS